MEESNIMKSFIMDEIQENGFSETEIYLFHTCIEATGCIYTSSEIVVNNTYNSYIEYIDSYIELADTLVYNAEKIKYEDYFIQELKYLLSNVLVEENVYKATIKQELSIQIYLNSYGWIVNEEYAIAINLDINLIDSNKLRLIA